MKNWNEYSRDHYLFILAQGELLLKETNETMKSIQSRSRFQILISLSLITGNISWFVNNQTAGFHSYQIAIIILLIGSLFFDIKALWKYPCVTAGSIPSEMINQEILKHEDIDDDEKAIISNECQNYSDRIKFNSGVNTTRLRYSTFAFSLLCAIPMVLITIYLFSSCLS
jgi:hypothetical protein